MNPRNISGSLKAAILIRSLGSEVAERIFNGLSPDEQQVVQGQLDQMGTVSAEVIGATGFSVRSWAATKNR
jgi:flagellar motor switch protein FliG